MQLVCNDSSVENFSMDEWLHWLTHDRCISLAVAEQAGIRFSDRGVTIPVCDEYGKRLYNKYRRAPWVKDAPKYVYDKGSTACLYGADLARDLDTVYITEGEFDALVLRSLGYGAVTSTGGASTFLPSWKEFFAKKNVILCYDADSAGVKGALRVLEVLGSARIAFIPWGYGKDVTDVVKGNGVHNLKHAFERTVLVTNDWKKTLDVLKSERVLFIQKYCISPCVIDMYIDGVHARIQEDKPVKRSVVARDSDEITRANSFPIRNLVKVNGIGFAHCVAGCKDKTASMKVYKDNHAYSFCCGKRHDAIGIYRALHPEVSFRDALNDLI